MDSHNHHEEPFYRKYIWSTDHKIIGLQYGITSLIFLLMMIMRWQLAYPESAVPLVGSIFGEDGMLLPEIYNSLGAMHGTIMIFLGIVPLAVGAFGNYIVPLQIGAPDMAFPKINAASYWCYFVGGVVMMSSFFTAEGAARSGWTSYPPLADGRTNNVAYWNDFSNYILFAWIYQFYHNHHPITCTWTYLDAATIFRLGSIRHIIFIGFGVSTTGSGRCFTADGSCSWHQFLFTQRSSCFWRSIRC